MRSYVDLCLFIRFIELSEERLGQEYPSGKEPEEILDLWVEHEATMPSYVFHELYHFWQGLRLPFVHRYANRSLGNLPLTLRWLGQHGVDLRSPQFETAPTHGRIALAWTAGSQGLNEHLQPMYASLSPLDLLEGAASLAEFQMLHSEEERTDWRIFDRWSKRNPAYTAALSLARTQLGDPRFALLAMLPLTCTAFATSDPVRAFGELLEVARKSRPTQAELVSWPAGTWTDLARALVHTLRFEAEPDAEEGYCRLLPSQMFRKPPHPIGGRLAQEWEERCLAGGADGDEYGRVMEMPGWVRDDVLQECRDRYGPPFSVVRFQWGDGSHSVQIYAAANSDASVFEAQGIPEILTTYGLLRRRTGLHLDEGTRLCHHHECSYFAANWCNTFPIVPSHHAQCTFPGYVASLTDLVLENSLMRRGTDGHY